MSLQCVFMWTVLLTSTARCADSLASCCIKHSPVLEGATVTLVCRFPEPVTNTTKDILVQRNKFNNPSASAPSVLECPLSRRQGSDGCVVGNGYVFKGFSSYTNEVEIYIQNVSKEHEGSYTCQLVGHSSMIVPCNLTLGLILSEVSCGRSEAETTQSTGSVTSTDNGTEVNIVEENKSQSFVWIIVGVTIGGVAVLFAVIYAIVLYKKRLRNTERRNRCGSCIQNICSCCARHNIGNAEVQSYRLRNTERRNRCGSCIQNICSCCARHNIGNAEDLSYRLRITERGNRCGSCIQNIFSCCARHNIGNAEVQSCSGGGSNMQGKGTADEKKGVAIRHNYNVDQSPNPKMEDVIKKFESMPINNSTSPATINQEQEKYRKNTQHGTGNASSKHGNNNPQVIETFQFEQEVNLTQQNHEKQIETPNEKITLKQQNCASVKAAYEYSEETCCPSSMRATFNSQLDLSSITLDNNDTSSAGRSETESIELESRQMDVEYENEEEDSGGPAQPLMIQQTE